MKVGQLDQLRDIRISMDNMADRMFNFATAFEFIGQTVMADNFRTEAQRLMDMAHDLHKLAGDLVNDQLQQAEANSRSILQAALAVVELKKGDTT